jgi:hypothetical protein
MQFQFYEPPAGLFKDLSAPEIMLVRRQAHLRESMLTRIRRKLSLN